MSAKMPLRHLPRDSGDQINSYRSSYTDGMNDLERHVIQQILTLEAADFPDLAAQLTELVVVSRHETGKGVFTNFSHTANLKPCRSCPAGMCLGQEVVAAIGPQEILAGFVLYIDKGIITTLESYVYDGPWPDVWPDDASQQFSLL